MNFPLPLPEMPNLPMYLYKYKDEIDSSRIKDILFFHKFGFFRVDLDLTEEFISELKSEMKTCVDNGNYETQSKYYSYNYKNVFYDIHKHSPLSEELLNNKQITFTIEYLFGKKPIPFHTISSFVGEMTSMHNQLMHIDTYPSRNICKVFVALENTNKDNATLKFSPKSHLLNRYTFEDFGIPYMENSIERLKIYNRYINDIIKFNSFLIKPYRSSKPSALIMSPSLYHGEKRLVDKNSTRFSQYNIYTFEDTKFFWKPVSSDIFNGKIDEIK